jgi:hypothetical protein
MQHETCSQAAAAIHASLKDHIDYWRVKEAMKVSSSKIIVPAARLRAYAYCQAHAGATHQSTTDNIANEADRTPLPGTKWTGQKASGPGLLYQGATPVAI